MTKDWSKIKKRIQDAGLPEIKDDDAYKLSVEQARRALRVPVPAHAELDKPSFPGNKRIEILALVDVGGATPAPDLGREQDVDELIINNVRLGSPRMRPAPSPVGGQPGSIAVFLAGEFKSDEAALLKVFPLSVRVRSKDGAIQIDGLALREPVRRRAS